MIPLESIHRYNAADIMIGK